MLTQGEIDGNGAGVQLTVSIDAADFSAGGHVNLTIVNGTATSNVELKLVNGELQLANGQPATGFTYNNGTISGPKRPRLTGASLSPRPRPTRRVTPLPKVLIRLSLTRRPRMPRPC
ncbi:hypothetical protein [Aeromonas veronii]|uniref:hypothetical protein n=1 Tax=Aeromonas veronii TaxID=654 RepID=UPI003F78E0D0